MGDGKVGETSDRVLQQQMSSIQDLNNQADKDFARQMALQALQQKIHAQQQEAMALSAIEKAKDDALKAIIQNMK